MPTVGEMKSEMAVRVRAEAERVGVEVNSLIMWPICAMDPFLEACGRLPTRNDSCDCTAPQQERCRKRTEPFHRPGTFSCKARAGAPSNSKMCPECHAMGGPDGVTNCATCRGGFWDSQSSGEVKP